MFRLPQNTALRAGLFMVLAMGSFVANDTIVKLVGQSLPVGEIIMIRGAMAALILFLICAWQAQLPELPRIAQRSVLLRSLFDVVGTIAFVQGWTWVDWVLPFSGGAAAVSTEGAEAWGHLAVFGGWFLVIAIPAWLLFVRRDA